MWVSVCDLCVLCVCVCVCVRVGSHRSSYRSLESMEELDHTRVPTPQNVSGWVLKKGAKGMKKVCVCVRAQLVLVCLWCVCVCFVRCTCHAIHNHTQTQKHTHTHNNGSCITGLSQTLVHVGDVNQPAHLFDASRSGKSWHDRHRTGE